MHNSEVLLKTLSRHINLFASPRSDLDPAEALPILLSTVDAMAEVVLTLRRDVNRLTEDCESLRERLKRGS